MTHLLLQVMAGVIDFKNPGPEAQKRQGLQITIHPEYMHGDLGKFDIALIKVRFWNYFRAFFFLDTNFSMIDLTIS